MKHLTIAARFAVFGLLLAGASGCGTGEVAVEQDDGSLRAALTRPTDELELEDLRTRADVAQRLLSAARLQIEAREHEQVAQAEGEAPIDAVARADAERARRQLDPLVVAAVRSEAQTVTVAATGRSELLSSAALHGVEAVTSVRVGEGFAVEPSEALRGRSEVEAVEQLGALISELGAELEPSGAGWDLMRRPGLRAGLVFLPDDGIVEINPTLLYYLSALDGPAVAVAHAPATISDPEHKPGSSDWEIFMRWLEDADPTSWTNLGDAPSQIDPNDPGTEPTPTPTPIGCPCCFCSVSGLGTTGQGLASLVLFGLPVGLLFLLRRRR